MFAKLHDAYETPNKMFILISEEIKGKSLIESLATESEKKTEEKKVALYIKQLLDCLHHLHSRNIVHLDLNPDNILVDSKSKKLKLIGFTHSKTLKPEIFSSNSNQQVYHDYGQPEFVAPEVVLRKPVTLNTDMWSVGVLAYILLSGKSPFYGSNPKQTLINVENCQWAFVDELNQMSLEAKDFITKLLTLDPKERMTAEQALNHPWIHFATQQTQTQLLDKNSLVEFHSRRVWSNQNKQKQPWMKLVRVSSLLDDVEMSDTGISSADSNDEEREKSQELSKEDTKQRSPSPPQQIEDVRVSSEEESLNPGTYLLPVRDPFFTVRMREYRRSRFDKLKQLEAMRIAKSEKVTRFERSVKFDKQERSEKSIKPEKTEKSVKSEKAEKPVKPEKTEIPKPKTPTSAPSMPPTPPTKPKKISQFDIAAFTQKTIKERYHVDVYGKLVQRGSLSRSTASSLRKSSSRASESPTSTRGESVMKTFEDFLDYRSRSAVVEGSAPLVREKLKDTFLLVGSTVTLRCRIEGNPPPRCFWYHNDRLIIGDDDRFKFAQAEDGVSTLSISKARVPDIGVYRCAARNRFGTVVTKSRLTVGDTPDRPARPIVAQYSCDQVYLIWDSPSFDGNSDILCFKVDFKISGDVKWSNALFTIEESCLIKNLQPLTNYRFRVSCVNTIGVSAFSWASEEVTTLAPGETKISIDHDQAQKLLKNQYNLERRSQQLVLVKKLDDESKDIHYKKSHGVVEEFKIQENHDPSDLYTREAKIYSSRGVSLWFAKDNANQTKRLIKLSSRINENEAKILRELKEQDRLMQLVEGFQYKENDSMIYAFVYNYSVPVLDFVTFKHKYNEELVVRILRQILDAVQWLHLHGFVHLTINPLTILNSNLTQVNVKLAGLDDAIQISELMHQTRATQYESESASSIAFHDKLLQPLEFSGKYY